jgi:ribose transport system substrate-binding protein
MWAGALSITIALSATLLCSGCGRSASHVISAIPHSATEAFCVAEHAGLAEAAARNHVSIYWNGPRGGDDSEQQILLVERAISQGDMGIVLTPNAPFALDTVIQRALRHGLPVVILSSPISLPATPNLSFVLNDVQRSGQLAAERIRRIAGNDEGEIAVAGADPMSPGSTDLANAFEASLAHTAPHIHIVSRLIGPFTFGQAEMAIEKTIAEHPHLVAIYALSVAATDGAVAAVRTSHQEGRIRIIGSDQTLDLLFMLRQGTIDSLVIQDMRGMGQQAVENIVAARNRRAVARVTYHQPVLLNSDNIDSEPIQQMLKMDWRPRE